MSYDERINKALAEAEALKLDPKGNHCIEEYNAGLTNAIDTIRASLEAAK